MLANPDIMKFTDKEIERITDIHSQLNEITTKMHLNLFIDFISSYYETEAWKCIHGMVSVEITEKEVKSEMAFKIEKQPLY